MNEGIPTDSCSARIEVDEIPFPLSQTTPLPSSLSNRYLCVIEELHREVLCLQQQNTELKGELKAMQVQPLAWEHDVESDCDYLAIVESQKKSLEVLEKAVKEKNRVIFEQNKLLQRWGERRGTLPCVECDGEGDGQQCENDCDGQQCDGECVGQQGENDCDGQQLEEEESIHQNYKEEKLLQQLEEEESIQQQLEEEESIQQQCEEEKKLQQHYEEEKKFLQQHYEEEKKTLQQQSEEEKKTLQQHCEEEKKSIQQHYEEEKKTLQQHYEEEKKKLQQEILAAHSTIQTIQTGSLSLPLSPLDHAALGTFAAQQLASFNHTLTATSSSLLASFSSLSSQLLDYRRRIGHLNDQLQNYVGNYRVMVRVRPVLPVDGSSTPAFSFTDDYSLVIHSSASQKEPRSFTFDRVFPPSVGQEAVFAEVQPAILSLFRGMNACVMAYGQTGAGKTFSMTGDEGREGVIPRCCALLFDELEYRREKSMRVKVGVVK